MSFFVLFYPSGKMIKVKLKLSTLPPFSIRVVFAPLVRMYGSGCNLQVYGALMWSMGKVFDTPEVIRVYIGSFWEKPLKHTVSKHIAECRPGMPPYSRSVLVIIFCFFIWFRIGGVRYNRCIYLPLLCVVYTRGGLLMGELFYSTFVSSACTQ